MIFPFYPSATALPCSSFLWSSQSTCPQRATAHGAETLQLVPILNDVSTQLGRALCKHSRASSDSNIEHHRSAIPMLISLVPPWVSLTLRASSDQDHRPSTLCMWGILQNGGLERYVKFLCVVPLLVFVANIIYSEKSTTCNTAEMMFQCLNNEHEDNLSWKYSVKLSHFVLFALFKVSLCLNIF